MADSPGRIGVGDADVRKGVSMTEGYRKWHIRVGPTEWVTFLGRRVAHIPGGSNRLNGCDATLYVTPEEELKLRVSDLAKARTTDVRPYGEESTELGQTGEGGLFSEEEARKNYPDLLQALLQQKQANEELGR